MYLTNSCRYISVACYTKMTANDAQLYNHTRYGYTHDVDYSAIGYQNNRTCGADGTLTGQMQRIVGQDKTVLTTSSRQARVVQAP